MHPTLSRDTPALLVGLDPEGLSAVDYFERVLAGAGDSVGARLAGNWVSQELVGTLAKEGLGWEDGREKVSVVEMAEVVKLVSEGGTTGEFALLSPDQLTSEWAVADTLDARSFALSRPPPIPAASAKTLLLHLICAPSSPSSRVSSLLSKHALTPLSATETDALCAAVIADAHAKNVGRRKPDKLVVSKLIGEVRKRSGGRADARVVGARLGELLKAEEGHAGTGK